MPPYQKDAAPTKKMPPYQKDGTHPMTEGQMLGEKHYLHPVRHVLD